MFMFQLIFTICVFVVVVMAESIVPRRSQYSRYERARRQKQGDAEIAKDIAREDAADDVSGILRVVGALALVVFILLALTTFDWLAGALLAVTGVVFYGTLARVSPIHDAAQRLYDRYEPAVLSFVGQHHRILSFFRGVPRSSEMKTQVDSREEFVHIAEQSPHVLNKSEVLLIKNGLKFGERVVGSIMTPRSVMDTVKRNDLLGPLLIDELHKTGHSRFPVIDGDVDHIVGVLYIHNLLQLHDKKTHKASELMSTPVYYIKEDQTLDHALAAFLRTHHHLFVVVNEYRETVGILTLEDTIEALLGRKIVDEFDTHEDLRTVAARNPRGNNHPAKHTDV
ncbi:TPA: hypothetical protein DEW05_01235 [Candidatus Saccharibacteria bacterium]|nr:hypothetical protein [Candidatus Saccharibacteria bacterium]